VVRIRQKRQGRKTLLTYKVCPNDKDGEGSTGI
jgi:hypothetical protein